MRYNQQQCNCPGGFTLDLEPSPSYLEEVLKVRLVVDASLEQSGSVDLTGAEADVGLHVGQLRRQNISDHLHWHVLPARLLANT